MPNFTLSDPAFVETSEIAASPIRQGLIMHWDAGDPNCYRGMGTTIITDLSGVGNNGTFITPLWTGSNGGAFVFNATNAITNTSLILSSGPLFTVMATARYTSATNRARIVSSMNNNWLLGHWNTQTENLYSEGWVTAAGAGPSDTNWRFYTTTGNIPGAQFAFYVNANLKAGPNSAGTQGPNGISLGRLGSNNGEPSEGQVGIVLAYNRVLSTTEIQQIYNIYRTRFVL